MLPKIIIIGIPFLVMITSGLLLSKGGKTLNTNLFTIHKIFPYLAILSTAVALFLLYRIKQ